MEFPKPQKNRSKMVGNSIDAGRFRLCSKKVKKYPWKSVGVHLLRKNLLALDVYFRKKDRFFSTPGVLGMYQLDSLYNPLTRAYFNACCKLRGEFFRFFENILWCSKKVGPLLTLKKMKKIYFHARFRQTLKFFVIFFMLGQSGIFLF